MYSYRLAPHAYVCVSADGAVFLDVRNDAYIGLDPEQARALAVLVEGWPDELQSHPDASSTDGQSNACTGTEGPSLAVRLPNNEFAESLVTRGLLVRTSERGRDAAAPRLPSGRAELIPWEHMRPDAIRLSHIFAFLLALLTTVVAIRMRGLETTVRRLQQRRRRRAPHCRDFDTSRAQNLVSAYHYIRTWVFARRGRCLLDSLTLLQFLAHYDVWPHWVVGVQFRPFAAHSWIQEGEWLLNGTPAFVRAYTPILVV